VRNGLGRHEQQQRCEQLIHALAVGRVGIEFRPHKQNVQHLPLRLLRLKELEVGIGARQVELDDVEKLRVAEEFLPWALNHPEIYKYHRTDMV
jgi:hypothetical protein